MNVAALLQDSPSDDRRRASTNPSHQPPQPHPRSPHPPNDGPPPQQPPSPQWPRASASSSRTQNWPPPFIRPASTHSDSAPPKDPAWSPVAGHASPKPYYSLLDNRTIPPPPSTSLLQRSRAGSQSSAHPHTPSPAAGGPYAKPPSSSSSPSTPFHPHPHPPSPRQPRLPANTSSPRVHPSLSSTGSSFPAPLAHISPAAPPTRPGPAEPLLGADSTGGPPPGAVWGHPNGVTGHVMGSNNLNLMDRHNISTGPALAGRFLRHRL
ncbi:hypothetical protein BJ912DRAFT_1053609 [Pholiota molesta]|nr:hypothetical protein BJ912DRAFT_1053609 [Pholiota molesta]